VTGLGRPDAGPARGTGAPAEAAGARGEPAEQTEPAEAQIEPAEAAGLAAGVAEAVRAAVRAEVEPILPYVVQALDRNSELGNLNDRLRTAERRIAARQERPLVAAVHGLLDRVRHFDFDPDIKSAIEADIVQMLNDAGYEETGRIGEAYDPARHQAIGGQAVDGAARVAEVHTCGLSCFGDVVFRAKVQLAADPAPRPWPGVPGWRQSRESRGQER
jgi:molecular chaperone GrpE (heat shock protein)